MAADKTTPIILATSFKEIAVLIRRVLNEMGFRVIAEVPDAELAFARLAALGPGLVIVDDTIAPSGGLSLLQEIRANENLKSVPLILMSAAPSKEMVVAIKAAGMADIIIKPFSIATLKHKLTALLGT